MCDRHKLDAEIEDLRRQAEVAEADYKARLRGDYGS
jgi:hypothetical protein